MIAILGALREEVSCLRKRMDIQETVSDPACTVFRGTTQGRDILLVQTGMGKQRAQAATQLVLERYPVATLVSLGFAGALDEQLQAGDVVLYSAVHCADAAAEADTKGSAGPSFAPSEAALARAKRRLKDEAVSFVCGPGASVPRVVLSPEDKTALAEAHQVLVVDMESYWIAEIAAQARIPYLIIRSVSDTTDEKMLPFDRMMNDDGKLLWKATAAHFIRRPHHLGVIGRLYRNARLAQRSLTAAVEALISEL